MLDVGVKVLLEVAEREGVSIAVNVIEGGLSLLEGVTVGEALGVSLPPKERVEGGVSDDEDVRLSVIDVRLSVIDKVESGVSELLSLLDVVAEGVGTALDVILALPPKEIVEGGVSDDDVVKRGVGVIVNESEVVIVAETLELAVDVIVLEPVDESDPVSALDDEVVTVAEKLLEEVCEDEGVCDKDGMISDDEGVRVTELVPDVDAPRVTEVVGVLDKDELKLCVVDTV